MAHGRLLAEDNGVDLPNMQFNGLEYGAHSSNLPVSNERFAHITEWDVRKTLFS
jgi:hypothetical protein